MATATLKGKLTLNDSLFHAGLRKAESGAKKAGLAIGGGLKNTIGRAVGVIGGLIAGTITAGAFAGGIKGAYDMGGSLADLSARTGAAAGELLILGQALADNGVEAAETGGIINKMQKTIGDAAKGSESAGKAVSQIGLSLRQLQAMRPTQQMQAIGQAINAIENPADRAAAAMDIFGKSGGKMLTMFADSEAIDGATNTLGRQAQLLSANSATFDTISDRLARAGMKLQGFFVGVASVLGPTMLQFTAALDKADFAAAGEKFGKWIVLAAETFTGAFANPEKLLGVFGNLLGAYFANHLSNLRAGLVKAAGVFGDALSGGVKLVRGGITGAIVLMYDGYINVAAAFNAVILSGVHEVLELLGSIPVLGKKLGLEGRSSPTLRSVFQSEKKRLKNSTLDDAMDVMRKGSQNDLASANGAIAKFTDVVVKGTKTAATAMVTGDFGRSAFLKRAAAGAESLRATGRAKIDQSFPNQIQDYMSDPWRKFRGFRTMGFGSGGLQTGSLNGSGGLSGGAFGAVRRGDKSRREAAERERLKGVQGVDKSNDLLSEIAGTIKTAWT